MMQHRRRTPKHKRNTARQALVLERRLTTLKTYYNGCYPCIRYIV